MDNPLNNKYVVDLNKGPEGLKMPLDNIIEDRYWEDYIQYNMVWGIEIWYNPENKTLYASPTSIDYPHKSYHRKIVTITPGLWSFMGTDVITEKDYRHYVIKLENRLDERITESMWASMFNRVLQAELDYNECRNSPDCEVTFINLMVSIKDIKEIIEKHGCCKEDIEEELCRTIYWMRDSPKIENT